jgi:hypothetical protein
VDRGFFYDKVVAAGFKFESVSDIITTKPEADSKKKIWIITTTPG